MNCHYCQKDMEEDEKTFTRHVAVCHPATSYYEVEICSKCHYFPKNNVESNKTIIK